MFPSIKWASSLDAFMIDSSPNIRWHHERTSQFPSECSVARIIPPEHGAFKADIHCEWTFLNSRGMAVWFTRSCIQNVSYTSPDWRHSRSGVVHETLLSSSQEEIFLSFFPNLRNSSGKDVSHHSSTDHRLLENKVRLSISKGAYQSYFGTLKSQPGKNGAWLTL